MAIVKFILRRPGLIARIRDPVDIVNSADVFSAHFEQYRLKPCLPAGALTLTWTLRGPGDGGLVAGIGNGKPLSLKPVVRVAAVKKPTPAPDGPDGGAGAASSASTGSGEPAPPPPPPLPPPPDDPGPLDPGVEFIDEEDLAGIDEAIAGGDADESNKTLFKLITIHLVERSIMLIL